MSEFYDVNQISDTPSETLIRGQVTTSLVDGLDWTENAKERLLGSSTKILAKGVSEVKGNGKTTGLVVGYVQSGKTMSFSTVLALAADNGFQLAIVFAGVTNQLLQQTRNRLVNELVGENWWEVDVKDDHTKFSILESSQDSQMVIVPVLKSAQRITELRRAISEQLDALTTPVLIIDDEADQASFNTLASRNYNDGTDEMSATFEAISQLRDAIGNHIYLQYTATPQAPLLINLTEILSPDWHVVLDPGAGYFGGKQLFRDRPKQVKVIPLDEAYHNSDNPLNHCPDSLEDALWEFVIASTIHLRFRKSNKTISMMVHPERVKEDHKKFYNWVTGLLQGWKSNLSSDRPSRDLRERIASVYKDYSNQIQNCPSLDEMLPVFPSVIHRIDVLLMNSDKQQDINWKQNRCAILVGGDLLNRGFTVEGLVITYMPRYSKGKSNADTLQQRARFFGYKAGIEDLIRVHLPVATINAFELYVDDEEVIREILRKSNSTQELRQTIVQNPVMRPTRANILSRKVIQSELTGAKPFKTHAIKHLDYNTQLLFEFVQSHQSEFSLFHDYGTDDRNHLVCSIGVNELINLLLQLKYTNAKEVGLKTAAIQYLLHWSSKESPDQSIEECTLVLMASGEVRKRTVFDRGESIMIQQLFSGRAKDSGAYPGDTRIAATSQLTLQIHRLQPIGHARGSEFWVPALVFPQELSVHFATTAEE